MLDYQYAQQRGLKAGDLVQLRVYRQVPFSIRSARLQVGIPPLNAELWSCTVRYFDTSQVVVTLPDGETKYRARWEQIASMTRLVRELTG